jgi:transcription elongation factor GreA
MADRCPMTPDGYRQLEADLKHLKTVARPQNVREIEEARAHGDISENAEFHAAKEQQSHIAGRIVRIEDKLARAQVIDPSGPAPDQVRFGTTVVLLDSETDEEVAYTIVGEDESDITSGRISFSSPIARALLGKAVDDTVTVRVPKGTREFEVREIR